MEKFTRRLRILFAPYLIGCIFLALLVFLNVHGNKYIIALWLSVDAVIAIILFKNCYKWSLNKIISVAEIEGGLEIEMVEKDRRRRIMVGAANLKMSTKRIGGKLYIVRLTLFDMDKKIIDVYAPASFRELSEVERLKYEINKYLG